MTEEYINEHPHIKSCLSRGLLNYSALSRAIAKELDLGRRGSVEAILIAARRMRRRLGKDESAVRIRSVLSKSELVIRNKMAVLITAKSGAQALDDVQRSVRKAGGVLYAIEGSENHTVIAQEQHIAELERRLRHHIVKKTQDVALITLRSPKEIERTAGVIAYLTALFAEGGVNLLEVLSCWTDTLFVVDAKDVQKAMRLLRF